MNGVTNIIKIPDPMDAARTNRGTSPDDPGTNRGLRSGLPSLPLNNSQTLTTIDENVTDRTGIVTARVNNSRVESRVVES